MPRRATLARGLVALGVGALIAVGAAQTSGQQGSGPVPIDANDIGGVVTSAKGPEAGVWVIAETTELPTRFARSVVTDDQGRYLLRDLPAARYSIWVRGYGLVDSPKVQATPGGALFHATAPAEIAQTWRVDAASSRWTPDELMTRCRDVSRRVPGYLCEMSRLHHSSPEPVRALDQPARRPDFLD